MQKEKLFHQYTPSRSYGLELMLTFQLNKFTGIAIIKYLCQRRYPWTDASFTLHLSHSASYSQFPGHQDSQVGKISNTGHVSENELDLNEIMVIDNFNVSPPRIAPKNRPSGFNANLHCHIFKEHEDVS